jgi:hypothetical protein
MSEQPTALWLADWLDVRACGGDNWNAKMNAAAAELRRLHALNGELLEALKRAADHAYWPDIEQQTRAAIAKAEGKV